jgi:hypothetical protein
MMRRYFRPWIPLFCAFGLALVGGAATTGCDRDEGAFEEAGEAVDDAADKARDAAD